MQSNRYKDLLVLIGLSSDLLPVFLCYLWLWNLVIFVVQEDGEGLKEPTLVVYKDKNFDSFVNFSSDENITFEQSTNKGGNANVL